MKDAKLGEEWFDEYWINHGSATMLKDGKTTKITTLKDFLEFKGRTDLLDKIVSKTSNKKENYEVITNTNKKTKKVSK